MALFGSLGKMLGLDTPFGQGVVEGFSEGVTREVRDDMKSRKERINRLADYKIRRDEEERERYTKELRENLEKLKGISGKVGGVTGAEYLVRTYGIEEAANKAAEIEAVSRYSGSLPEFFTNDKNITKLEDLASFVTTAPTFTKLIARGTREDTGLLSKIGLARNITEDVQAEVDKATSVLGVGKVVAPDLGEIPTTDLDLVSLGMMADAEDEMKRMITLSLNAEDPDMAKKYRTKADEMRLFLQSVSVKGGLTEPQGRAAAKLFGARLGMAAGFETQMDGVGGFITSWGKTQNKTLAFTIESVLADTYRKAVNSGMQHTEANKIISQGIATNRMPKFDMVNNKPSLILEGQPKLAPDGFIGGKGAYKEVVKDPQTDTDNNTSGVTNNQAEIQALINAHNSTTDLAEKAAIEIEIQTLLNGKLTPAIKSQLTSPQS